MKHIIITLCTAMCISLALNCLAAREKPLYDSTFFQPSEEVVTPHIPWLKPSAVPGPRVLFITHRKAMREVVELAQRMDMRYKVFACEKNNQFGETGIGVDSSWRLIQGNSAEELTEQLRKDLAMEWDVIVIGNIQWSILPVDCCYEILKKIKAGTGLVGCIPKDGRDEFLNKLLGKSSEQAPVQLSEGVPWKSLPAFSKQKDAKTFLRSTFSTSSLGAGRIGLLNCSVPVHQMLTPGPTGRVQDCQLDYDYYLAMAIRLILWGAKHDLECRVTCSSDSIITMTRDDKNTPTTVTFRIQAAKPVRKASLELKIRNRRNRIWHDEKQKINLEQGANRIDFNLARLPCGSYFADLLVMANGKVLGFGSTGLEINSNTKIAKLSLAQESFGSGEPVKGEVAVENPVPGLSVRLQITDLHGRVTTLGKADVVNGTASFTIRTPPALTLVQWLEAELMQGNDIIDVQTIDYLINNRYPDHNDVQFVMWDNYPADFVGPMIASEFTRNGIDAFYGGSSSSGYGPYANQWWLPYATRFTDSKTDWYQLKPTRKSDDLVRTPCLTDPKYRAEVRKGLEKTAKAALNCSTADFTLGDENLFVSGSYDLCFSETCLADFRAWAQKEYGTLEMLNASWGSSFKTWDEVKPSTLEECRKTENYVPWVDHRLHMESVWAGMHSFSRDVIRSVVPKARVGYEGSDSHVSTWLAADFWKLAHAMNLNNIYYRDFLSLAWHDFVEEGTLLGAGWFGGYTGNRNEPFMRWFPWRALFKGSNSLWVWCGYGSAGSVMSFDTSLYPFFKAACEEVREIKSGTGKLLMASHRQHDGIALLYSASSVHMATCTAGFPSMDKELNAIVNILHDIGLECRVLSYEEVAAGKLQNPEFKALILPCCQALGRDETSAIRRFIENGGYVIADLRPGMTDRHGKPYPKGELDGLFGIQQTSKFKKEIRSFADPGIEKVTCDGSLALGSGRASLLEDGVSAMVSNSIGKGCTLLLNFSLDMYTDKDESYRRMFRSALDKQGIKPRVRVEPDAPGIEVSRFVNGPAEYIGIVQALPVAPIEYTNRKVPPPQAKPVNISFGRESYVYDIRTGAYLGKTATLATTMTPGIAKMYALLPEKARKPALDVPGRAMCGQSIKCSVGGEARTPAVSRVIRIKVSDPDGQEMEWYKRNILVKDLSESFAIDFALNDKPGKWRISATDVASGLTETRTLKVKGVSAK